MKEGWLLVTAHDAWHQFLQEGYWAFDRETRMKQVEPGEEAIVYLTQSGGYSSFGGILRFAGKQRTVKGLRGAIFHVYPYHVPIEPVYVPISPVPIEKLFSKLTFLPKTPHWGAQLQGRPLRPIPRTDYDLIRATLLATPPRKAIQ